MGVEPPDLPRPATVVLQRHSGARHRSDLLQRLDHPDRRSRRRHRTAADALPDPDGGHHARRGGRPDAHHAQRSEQRPQRPLRLGRRLRPGRAGRNPGRPDADSLGHGPHTSHRRRLRGLRHRPSPQHPHDLRRSAHPGARRELHGRLLAPKPVHPGLRRRGPRGRPLRRPAPAPSVPIARPPHPAQPRARPHAVVARHRTVRRGRHRGRHHAGDGGLAVRSLQPEPGLGAGHHRVVARTAGGIRRSAVPVPDDLRRDRGRRRRAPRGERQSPGTPRGRRPLRGSRGPDRASRLQVVRDLFRSVHRRLRHRDGRLGVPTPRLQPVRRPVRAVSDKVP